jgi:mannan endo-1,4-beta-mannosidase
MNILRVVVLLVFGFGTQFAWSQVDVNASPEARALYRKLFTLSRDYENGKVVFGQQGAFHEGRGWSLNSDRDWTGRLPETDLRKVMGKDPGVVGFDFSEIGSWNESLFVELIRALHEKGAIITLSWHMPNFFPDGTETNAWDTNGNTVSLIRSDEAFRKRFLSKLDRLVSFLGRIKGVPVIFRPWHEQNYSWFWWGKSHCTRVEYSALWKLTSEYLMSKGVHQLLYAYSPDTVGADYFDRYPGDSLVDILGVDTYFNSLASNVYFLGLSPLDQWKRGVIQLMNAAEARGKIPAITEFGNEGLTYDRFWTDYFSWPIERDGLRQFSRLHHLREPKIKAAYAMVWRNDRNSPQHFFGPFPGAPGNSNFFEMLSKSVFSFLGEGGIEKNIRQCFRELF